MNVYVTMCIVKLHFYAKKKHFPLPICLEAESELSIHILSNVKTLFADNSRTEPTTLFPKNISLSLKVLAGHFYGQSFIKTVRGHS